MFRVVPFGSFNESFLLRIKKNDILCNYCVFCLFVCFSLSLSFLFELLDAEISSKLVEAGIYVNIYFMAWTS